MKTTKFLMMFIAVAMLFTACKKDKPQPDNGNNGNNETPAVTEAAENTLVFNGKVYQLNCGYSIDVSQNRSYAGGHTVETDANGESLYEIMSDVEDFCLNRTFDLTTEYEDATYYFVMRTPDYSEEYSQGNTEGYGVNGIINGEYYEDSSIFSSGTLTISRTETDFTYKLTGKLKTGQNLSFHIHVPASEWQYEEYK